MKVNKIIETNKFTATQLVRGSSEVFNEVQRNGWAKLTSKTRPDMVVITQDCLDEMLLQQFKAGKKESTEEQLDLLK